MEDYEMNQETHFTKQRLKERGWTDSLINRFLPYPDAEEPNPVHKGGAPMKLYLISRVREVEYSPEFTEAVKALTKKRRRRSEKRHE